MPVVTLSSVGNSDTISLDPICKATSLSVTAAAGSTIVTGSIQGTLNNLQTETVTWFTISSAISVSTAATTAVFYTVLSPLNGVRLLSSAAGGATLTLTALQSDPV